MAALSKWRCPICCNPQNDAAYLIPCLHQFCLGCAMRSAVQKRNCPVCMTWTWSVLFSTRSDNNVIGFNLPGLAEAAAEDQQEEEEEVAEPAAEDQQEEEEEVGKPAAEDQQEEEEEVGKPAAEDQHDEEEDAVEQGHKPQVGGFPAEVWAGFFKSHPDNIRPLQLWLRQQLEVLFGGQWWKVTAWEGSLVGLLCLHGLDVAVLKEELQTSLKEDTRPFILRLITAAMCLCGTEIRRHLGQHNSLAASPSTTRGVTPDCSLAPSSSPAGFNVEEARTSEAALRKGPGYSSSAPVSKEQRQHDQEKPGEVAAAGLPSGCSRERPPGGPRRPPKRRAPSSPDNPPPCKRPHLAASPSPSPSCGETPAPHLASSSRAAGSAVPSPFSGCGRERLPGGPRRPTKSRARGPTAKITLQLPARGD